jgi:hypothetical protein
MYCFQFAVFLLVILIIEIAIGIVVFVTINGGTWDQAVRERIEEIFAGYPTAPTPEAQPLMDEVNNLQRNVSQCCMLKKYGPIFFSTCKGYPVQLLA